VDNPDLAVGFPVTDVKLLGSARAKAAN